MKLSTIGKDIEIGRKFDFKPPMPDHSPIEVMISAPEIYTRTGYDDREKENLKRFLEEENGVVAVQQGKHN